MNEPGPHEAPESTTGGAFLAGLFTGALVGAGLAMILSPTSGEDVRDGLRVRAREARNRAVDGAVDARDRASEFYERGKKLLDEAREGLDERPT